MKHYGPEPPWRGRSRHYGSWQLGPEYWDGDIEWVWIPPTAGFAGAFTSEMNELLKYVYLGTVRETFNQPLLFPTAVTEDTMTVSVVKGVTG